MCLACSGVCVYVFVTVERASASRTMTGVPGTERERVFFTVHAKCVSVCLNDDTCVRVA